MSQETDIKLTTSAEHKTTTLEYLSSTISQVDIFCQDLNTRIYNNKDVYFAIKNIIAENHYAQIRILIYNVVAVITNDHLLVELFRHLSSSIEMRKISEQYKGHYHAYMICDKRALIYRNDYDRFEGYASPDAPGRCKDLLNTFDEIWEHSEPDSNLRQLFI